MSGYLFVQPPSVGDMVWVESIPKYEELATVLSVDAEMDCGETTEASEKRVAQNGIFVELYDSRREIVVLPSAIVRPFRSASPRQTRAQRQVITPSPTTSEETSQKPKSKRKRGGAKLPSDENNKEDLTSPHFAKEKAAVGKSKKNKDSAKKMVAAKKTASASSKKQKVESVLVSASAMDSADGYSSDSESDNAAPVSKRKKLASKTSASTGTSKKSAAASKKPATKSKKAKAKASTASYSSSSSASESESDKTSPPPKRKKTQLTSSTAKKPAAASKKPAPKSKKASAKKTPPAKSKPDSESDASFVSEEENEDLDRPFKIEYSTTGRATCKRCDEKIAKGDLRISHVPLFRGKPGFKVYRHLRCAVFSEEVVTAKDVGGYSKLKKKDYQLLVDRVEESKIEVQKENEELDPDELVPVSFQGEIRSPPPGLTATLLPFQNEGTSWMYCQECTSETRGGILADEMGLGKTLQSIVTTLDNRPLLQHSKPGAKHPPSAPDLAKRKDEEELWNESLESWKSEMEVLEVPKDLIPKARGNRPGGGARAGTLVVCPVVALSQWKSEIEKFTEDGTLTVGVYHGPKRGSETPRDLMLKYDVVLTTYQVLEHDFRKMTSPNKVKCPLCGGKFKIDKLRVHLKYFCGEGAERTEAQARQRRSRDQGRGSGSEGKGSGNSKGDKKKSFTSKKVAPKKTAKKVVRIKSSKDYDSESDLSIASEDEAASFTSTPVRRPSRAAAVSASKQLSKSKAEWAEKTEDTDSDAYSDDEESSDDESSDDESTGRLRNAKPLAKKMKTIQSSSESESDNDGSSDSDDSSSDSEEDEAMQRARQKQAEALALAKSSKKKPAMKKNVAKKKSMGGKKKATAGKKRKKFDDEDDSSSDDDERDPMEGIDMDELLAEAMEGCQMSVLHSICWWRIILDEAHCIKTRSSGTANAAFSLIGIHRWCLSGTPLQNRVGELYSLIRFLRIDPMAYYFCRAKDCDCKSLHYRMFNGKCKNCGHGSVQHFSYFNKHVLNPIKTYGYTGDGRRAMFKLKTDILDKCLLRRTKETKAEDLNLPPRLVAIRKVRLHPVEEDFYNALYTQTKSSFNDYVEEGTLLNNYAHIFDLLMRMRQAVDHPYLVVFSKRDSVREAAEGAGRAVANGSVVCELCHEPPTDRVLSSCCQAAFCRGCVMDYMSSLLDGADDAHTPCPSCNAPFSIDLNQASKNVVDDETLKASGTKSSSGSDLMPSLKELPHVATGSILRRINLADFATSSKIEALTQELVQMRQNSPGSKAIIFSQFVSMIDLIRWRLHSDPCLTSMGLGVRALHGSMDVKARDASLKDFREDPNVRVLLMSLKAGGVALNLTVANHIYLMDPWWNPAAEMQAIDRTHRLGQYRPIRAVRFIAENTVEERILQLQEKKRLVFDGTVGRDAGSLKMLTVDDMKSLFA